MRCRLASLGEAGLVRGEQVWNSCATAIAATPRTARA